MMFDKRVKLKSGYKQNCLTEEKAEKINVNVIHERPQDIKHERTQPMSKLRKLSDTGTVSQRGWGRENWMCH